ncbi:hypothetical protein BH20ACI2_BH20ACI2_17070 [soil metagenome]
MKQDYLWDKTGSDPDIERLEELLSDFRYRERAAAVTNVVPFPLKTKGSPQPWIFAMAACVALAAASIGIWNLSTKSGEPEAAAAVQVAEDSKQKPMMPVITADIGTPEKIESTPDHILAVEKQKTRARRKHTAQAAKLRGPRVHPVLTKEEKYAYGQLMLALAISSSKLQLIQDSINGVEQNDTMDKK